MKWIFGVICLTASLAAVSATFCKTADDCKEGYCCVGLTMSQMMKKGLCLRLTRERRQCNEPESKHEYYGGKFMRYCPCDEGMVCEPNKEGITDPEKRRKLLRCKKPSGTTTGPDITTASNIVTDDEIVDTTRDEIVTDPEIVTTPPEVVTDDDIVDETLPPEIVTDETEAPEEETLETEAPEEETVEPEVPEEETVEPEVPEEETVEPEVPEEETVEPEVPEEETETPEEGVDENPEDEVVEEAGQRGPGGERPRTDDPDCEDWTYGC